MFYGICFHPARADLAKELNRYLVWVTASEFLVRSLRTSSKIMATVDRV